MKNNMNIWQLHLDPYESARMLVEKDRRRANKQIVKTIQCLATVGNLMKEKHIPLTKDGSKYEITHKGHPVIKWIMESYGNAMWSLMNAVELNYYLNGRKSPPFHKSLVNKHSNNIEKCLAITNNLPKKPYSPLNLAKNKGQGIDFTDMPVPFSYINYLNFKLENEKCKEGIFTVK